MSHKKREKEEVLREAVTLMADVDALTLLELFTEESTFWSAGLELTFEELADELQTRDDMFDGLAVEIDSVDVVGDRGYAEWVATATHTGPFHLDEEDGQAVIEATQLTASVRGVTVADFDGHRISALRQYWDEVGLMERLGLLPVE